MRARMTDTEVELFKANEHIAELEAENERLAKKCQNYFVEVNSLEVEIERLRKEIASYRKGDCRRKIDKAMEGE